MINIRVNDAEVKRKLNALLQDKEGRRKVLSVVANEGSNLLKAYANYTGDTRHLANSIRPTEITDRSAKIEMLGYGEQALEYGRKPGKYPPMQALKGWAKRKLGNEKMAFIIARNIGLYGTSSYRKGGNRYITQAFRRLNKIMPKILTEYIESL